MQCVNDLHNVDNILCYTIKDNKGDLETNQACSEHLDAFWFKPVHDLFKLERIFRRLNDNFNFQ